MFDAEGLADNPNNRLALIEEQTIPRGVIYAGDGRTGLAVSRARAPRRRRASTCASTRRRPSSAHPIGYSFIQNGRRGLEQSRNDELAGQRNEFESLFAGSRGRDREGNDVITNLDLAGTRRRGGRGWRAARAPSSRSSRRPARWG